MQTSPKNWWKQTHWSSKRILSMFIDFTFEFLFCFHFGRDMICWCDRFSNFEGSWGSLPIAGTTRFFQLLTYGFQSATKRVVTVHQYLDFRLVMVGDCPLCCTLKVGDRRYIRRIFETWFVSHRTQESSELINNPVVRRCVPPIETWVWPFYTFINGENEGYGGKKVEGVGGMKDKALNLEEIEVSHTLGEPILVVYCERLVYYEGITRELNRRLN